MDVAGEHSVGGGRITITSVKGLFAAALQPYLPIRKREEMRAMLLSTITLCAVLGGGCAIRSQSEVPPLASQLEPVAALDSIRLTYRCGNRFRIRSYYQIVVDVKWDVYGTTDSGHVLLPARTSSQPYSETVFNTQVKGTTRLFHGGQLIQSTANDDRVCPAEPFPDTLPRLPQSILDSLPRLLVGVYPDSNVVLSQVLIVTFEDSVTTVGKQAVRDSIVRGSLLGAYTVGGTYHPYYVFRAPYATTFDSLDTLLKRLKASPRVFTVEFFVLRPGETPSSRLHSESVERFPVTTTPLPQAILDALLRIAGALPDSGQVWTEILLVSFNTT
jgi:hypothetical protein